MAWRALLRRCPSRSFTGRGRPRPASRLQAPVDVEEPSALRPARSGQYAERSPHRTPPPSTLAEGVVARRCPCPLPDDSRARRRRCYRVTRGRTEDAARRDNSPLWRAVAQAQREAEERRRGRTSAAASPSLSAAGARVGNRGQQTALSEPRPPVGRCFQRASSLTPVISSTRGDRSDGVGDAFRCPHRATHDVHVVPALLPPAWKSGRIYTLFPQCPFRLRLP